MHILHIPHELLEKILESCSVEDVLTLSQTCKALAEACRARTVWTHQLRTLADDEAPDLPPHVALSPLPTSRLRTLVVEACRRKALYASDASTRTYERVDVLTNLPRGANAQSAPMLLPGGELALVSCGGKVELWSVSTRRVLFRTFDGEEDAGAGVCASFAADMRAIPRQRQRQGGGGEAEEAEEDAVGVEVEVTLAGVFVRDDTSAYVAVFVYDVATGVGRHILSRELFQSFLWRPVVLRNFVMLHNATVSSVVLIDYETLSVTTVDFAPASRIHWNPGKSLVGLEDTYILATLLLHNTYALTAIPLSSIGDRWSSSAHHQDWPKLKFVPKSQASEQSRSMDDDNVFGDVLRLWDYRAGEMNYHWCARMHVLTRSWRQRHRRQDGPAGVPRAAEILLLKTIPDNSDFLFARDSSRVLVVTRVRLSEVSREEGGESLSFLGESRSSINQKCIPWSSVSISESGRMFYCLGSTLYCSDLSGANDENMDPKVVLALREESDEGMSMFYVDPWSEDIMVGYPGQLLALKIRAKS